MANPRLSLAHLTVIDAHPLELIASAWFSAAFPVGTPVEIIAKMSQEIAKALPAPEVKQKTWGRDGD
jgi:hypothetical protein